MLKSITLALYMHLTNIQPTDIAPLNKTMCSVAPMRGDTLKLKHGQWDIDFIRIRDGSARIDNKEPSMSDGEFMKAWDVVRMEGNILRDSIMMLNKEDYENKTIFPLTYHIVNEIGKVDKSSFGMRTLHVNDPVLSEPGGILSITHNNVKNDLRKDTMSFQFDPRSLNGSLFMKNPSIRMRDIEFSGDSHNPLVTVYYDALTKNKLENI